MAPCFQANLERGITHNRRVILACVYKDLQKAKSDVADAFRTWILSQLDVYEPPDKVEERKRQLRFALDSKSLTPDKHPCTARSTNPNTFFCPVGGNTSQCASKVGIADIEDMTVGKNVLACCVSHVPLILSRNAHGGLAEANGARNGRCGFHRGDDEGNARI